MRPTRRTFIGSTAGAASGAALNLSAAEDIDPPPAPRVVARGDTWLRVVWDLPQADLATYEIRALAPDGSAVSADRITPGQDLQGLSVNTAYVVSVRRRIGQEVSAWSASTGTGTRPPIPGAPAQGFQEMTRSGTFVTLTWDLAPRVEGIPEAAAIRVTVGTTEPGGLLSSQSPTDPNSALPVTGWAAFPWIAGATYHLRLTVNRPFASPNESDWSPGLSPVDLSFGGLTPPGQLSRHILPLDALTRYYA